MYGNRNFNRWRRHPWHGLRARPEGAAEDIVQVYIEMTPADVVKYELDKDTGFLMVDRPQRTTSSPPALYGFIPRTYCGTEVANNLLVQELQEIHPSQLPDAGLFRRLQRSRPVHLAQQAHLARHLAGLERGDLHVRA